MEDISFVYTADITLQEIITKMISMISVTQTTLKDITALRNEHLCSLPEFQDLFLELQIPHAKVMLISYT